MVMGVSMSKSDNSFSEDSGSIYIKDVVPQTDVSETEESEQVSCLLSGKTNLVINNGPAFLWAAPFVLVLSRYFTIRKFQLTI